jgi:hypothetical protein
MSALHSHALLASLPRCSGSEGSKPEEERRRIFEDTLDYFWIFPKKCDVDGWTSFVGLLEESLGLEGYMEEFEQSHGAGSLPKWKWRGRGARYHGFNPNSSGVLSFNPQEQISGL